MMTRKGTIISVIAATAVFAGGVALSTPANAATAVEKLYADLAKMDAKARTEALLEGAKKEGKLTYIQTITSKIGLKHGAAFRKDYPFLETEITQIGSNDGGERLTAEERSGRHLTSLISLAIPDMVTVMEADIAAPYKSVNTANILPQYKDMLDPENRWTPWYWSAHGITYNTNMLKGDDIPKSYFDLCKPHMKGQVSFDPSETRFLMGMNTMLGEKKFEEWLDCMGKNVPIVQNGHTARLTLMIAGDHSASPDQYLYRGTRMHLKNPKKVPFAVQYEAPVLAYGAGIVINHNSPQPYASALFADWSLTAGSQELMKTEFRGPVSISHPYMPANANLVVFKYEPIKKVEWLHEMWAKYVTSRK